MRPWFDSWVRKIHWRRDRLPTPVFLGFPCGSAGKESACNVEDLGSTPGLGRSPGEGKDYPLQYSGLENAMHCIVHEVAKSRTRLSNFHRVNLTKVKHKGWENGGNQRRCWSFNLSIWVDSDDVLRGREEAWEGYLVLICKMKIMYYFIGLLQQISLCNQSRTEPATKKILNKHSPATLLMIACLRDHH